MLNGANVPATVPRTFGTRRISPGLGALLREHDDPAAAKRPRDFGFLKWPLLTADLLLCVLTTMLIWQNPGTAQIIVGIFSVLLGAWLGCLAFWLE